MKIFLGTFFSIIALFLIAPSITHAYTMEDVEKHNTPGDCWMMFEGKVYDLTDYIRHHDVYMDIRYWCGKDITGDFKTKAEEGRDHTEGSYMLLDRFEITKGDERVEEQQQENEIVDTDMEMEDEINEQEEEEERIIGAPTSRYNIIVPFVTVMLLYWGTFFLTRKNLLSLSKYNAFWNTMLLLTFLIPSFGFGIFLIMRLSRPELWELDFDFLYWHVQLSLVMSFIALNHFIQRIPIYLQQLKG
jgi:cytochrome b involved in lipid metabolism